LSRRAISAFTRVFDALWHPSFVIRAIETDRAIGKYGHVNRETDPVQGKGRGGACLSVFR